MKFVPGLLLSLLLPALPAAQFSQVEVFRAGEGGYHTYRIPALIVTKAGTLLAFCEGRRGGSGDSGDIDLLLKRSHDNGRTWSPAQVVADFDGDTIGNPAPVIDRKTGDIVLLLTRNPGAVKERQIIDGTTTGTRTVWLTRSTNDGATWTTPQEITASVKLPDWTWYATGPGNGIQLRSGRLVIPCDHIVAGSKANYSHIIFSDDGGKTWSLGGSAGDQTNESAVVELRDHSLLLNMRSNHGRNRRAIATSHDRGLTWSPVQSDGALIEPVCQASLIRFGKRHLLFSNPADTKRVKMTVKLSTDEGKSWTRERLVHDGPSAYSSLARLKSGLIGLLYERGERSAYERITFAAFDLAWLQQSH
jgi:sialidase-1